MFRQVSVWYHESSNGAICSSSGVICSSSGAICSSSGVICSSSGAICSSSGAICSSSGAICSWSGNVCCENQNIIIFKNYHSHQESTQADEDVSIIHVVCVIKQKKKPSDRIYFSSGV